MLSVLCICWQLKIRLWSDALRLSLLKDLFTKDSDSSSRDNSDNIVLRKSTWECEDRMSSHRPIRSLHPLLFPPLATREQNSRVNVGDNEPCVLLRVECLCWPFVLLNITKQLSYLFSLITRGYRGNTQGLMNFKIHGEKWPPRANTE